LLYKNGFHIDRLKIMYGYTLRRQLKIDVSAVGSKPPVMIAIDTCYCISKNI
jgi:hypothetical protein